MSQNEKIKRIRKLLKDLAAINTLYRTTPKWITTERSRMYQEIARIQKEIKP